MPTLISGATGIDKVQDNSITSAKIADGTIVAADMSGTLADQNTPAFMAVPHISGDYIASSTWAKVDWTTEVYDTDSKFASSRFTPTVAGKYHFTCQIMWEQIDDRTNNHIALYKNGSEYHRVMFYSVNPSGGGGGPISSASLDVTAISDTDDYFEIYVYQSSGGRHVRGTTHSTGSYFSAFKLAGA